MTSLAMLSLSLEDADDLDTNVPESAMESDAEVTEAEMEMLEAEEELDDLESSAEGMEEIEEELTQEAAGGGLTPEAAKWLRIACRNAMGPHTKVVVGDKEFEVNKSPVMSLESFGSSDTSANATAMSLESIGDTIKKIWQAIKNAVMRVINAVREFFAKIFRGTKGLKKEIEEVRNSMKGKTFDTKKKMKVPGVASRLHTAGKVDGTTVSNGLRIMRDGGTDFYTKYIDAAAAYYESLAKKLVDASAGKAEAETVLNTATQELSGVNGHLSSLQKKNSKELPGGMRLVYTDKANEDGGVKLGRLSIEQMGKEYRSGDEGQEINLPAEDQLNGILKSAEEFIKLIDDRKAQVEKLGKAREAAVAAGDALSKAGDKNWFAEKWDQAKVRTVLRLTNINLSQSLSSYTSYGFKVARAGIIYVKAAVAAA